MSIIPRASSSPDRLNAAGKPARDVLAALALKGVLLMVIYLLFFSSAHRSRPDASTTATALLGPQPQQEQHPPKDSP